MEKNKMLCEVDYYTRKQTNNAYEYLKSKNINVKYFNMWDDNSKRLLFDEEENKNIDIILNTKGIMGYLVKDKTRYYVSYDFQGGEFGMYRNYTVKQWQKQALEWCYADDNYGLAEDIFNLKYDDILPYISMIWELEFKKCRKDKKNFKESDFTDYEDETLKEFYNARFEY